MWTKTPVPPTRYEVILKAIDLTDAAIANAVDDYTNQKLLSQRRLLVEALANDEDPEEEEEDVNQGPWKCDDCGQIGRSEEELVDGMHCPACRSGAITYAYGNKEP
jgi:predicted Zn-ribbon and HTH transcriptional regulator